MPGRHQFFGFIASARNQVKHASGTTAAGAALGVRADRSLLLQKFQGLLQNGLRKPQLRLFTGELLQEAGGIVVVLQEAFQDPADRKLKIEELWWRLPEVLLDIREAGARGLTS